MRKLLLASVCTLGALGMVASANAQTSDQANPMTGTLIAKPGPAPGANNNNNAFGTARPGASAVPTPGTMVIHFNTLVRFQWFQGWNSVMNEPAGTSRTSNQMMTYMRLYGGADGMAANGLRYGGAFEVRTNAAGTANTPAAGNPGSQGSAANQLQTLYMRRAFVYLGTDQLGIVRLGLGDGLISLYDAGRTTLQTYSPTAHFNGSDLQASIGGNSAPPFILSAVAGNEYDTQKIVYLSPNFSGFDFGLQYSPSAFTNQPGCGLNASTCANLTTANSASGTTATADGMRYKDMISAGIRYSGKVGPVDVLAYGVYSYAGHVNVSGTSASLAAAGSTWNGRSFDNLSFGSVGVALTYEGFTLAGNFLGGAVNGQLAARPSGGAPAMAWLVGAQYAVPGIPLTIGAVYMSQDSQGAVQLTKLSQRHEYGFSFGGSYRLAPGMTMYADYLYQSRYQGGWNFATGTVGAARNSVQGQGFVFGTQMLW